MVTDVQHRQQQPFQQGIEVLHLSDRSFSDPVSCHNWRLARELAEGKNVQIKCKCLHKKLVKKEIVLKAALNIVV